jgi:hypothetical protein
VSSGGVSSGGVSSGGVSSGGVSSGGVSSGGVSSGGGPSGGVSSGGTAGSLPVPKTDCVVAVHADQCCTPAVAASAASMSADPCLVPYGLQVLPAVIAACPEAGLCHMRDCVFPSPPSRIAEPDPNNPGNCRIADECTTVADCTIATDIRFCCACPEAVPQKLGLANPCIVPPGPPVGFVCQNCVGVMCEPCPSSWAEICTGAGGAGYRTCVEVSPTP